MNVRIFYNERFLGFTWLHTRKEDLAGEEGVNIAGGG